MWDSDAGQEFRRKAAGTAADIGRTHHRFITVAAALGRHPAGSTGYAARLQAHQGAADAAVSAVNGNAVSAGSEAERRSAWNLLLDAAGSWLDVGIDAVGLVTFGIGKSLIGGAEATAGISEAAASSYRAVPGDGSSGAALIEAGDTAAKTAKDVNGVSIISKMLEQTKEVVSVRPVFSAAVKAWQGGKLGAALGGDATPFAQGTAWGCRPGSKATGSCSGSLRVPAWAPT